MDGFSKTRAYSVIPLVVLVILFYFVATQVKIDQIVLMVSYFALLLTYVVVNAIINQRKLQALQMPKPYQRFFTLAQVVSMLGVAWFFFTMLLEHFKA
jgi:hypothetical protein